MVNGNGATDVTWEIPEFRHPVTDEVVPSVCSQNPPANFTRGRSTVQCMAYLYGSSQTAVCEFTVTVERKLRLEFILKRFADQFLCYKALINPNISTWVF